ncbi:MAG: cytochrome c peroxidase [Sneathiella sp.]|uniref:cytochrome-c peroxidase n=1 Tax=Sneathiella sp. TaxID=1964365 RepID=UPI0030027DF3
MLRRREWLGVVVAGALTIAGSIYWGQDLFQSPPTAVQGFSAPFVFGRFYIPEDNPLTEEAFQLGRKLFYDPRLSGNNQVSCATCHNQALAFTDGRRRAIGVSGEELAFSSMSLSNLLWGPRHFFWDGRSPTLEAQALLPIQNPDEMDQDLDQLVFELAADPKYEKEFSRAYGEVSGDNIAKALSTFMRMLISQNSKYDKFLRGELTLTDEEELGRKLFVAHPDVKVSKRGGNCVDCHSQFLTGGFKDAYDGFSNNGLDDEVDLLPGLQSVTGDPAHKGLFKVPTLRNIALTAPYMHDGRLPTLEAVLDHYNKGVKISSTLDPLIVEANNIELDKGASIGLSLSPKERKAIIAFLHTLTDDDFIREEKFSNPFRTK